METTNQEADGRCGDANCEVCVPPGSACEVCGALVYGLPAPYCSMECVMAEGAEEGAA